MTWALRTFFKVLLALSLSGALTAGTVTGKVRLTNADRNPKAGKVSSVVIWLEAMEGAFPAISTRHSVMLQQDKKFTPHLLVIRAGSSVEFPNLDPIFHNAFSNFNGKVFDIGLYAPGASRTVRFDRPGVVRVFCNIHPTMSAVIVVVDSPFFTTASDDGGFSLPNVANGEYAIHFFYERATPETLERLTHSITVNGNTDLPPIGISEAGYLPVAHTNKYGHEYPKGSDAPKTYSLPIK
jgi:plastocyanin